MELNYATDKSISYSQYSVYKSCKHQWYLNYYLKNFLSPPTIHLVFGTAIHTVLQKYFEKIYTVSGKKADEMDLTSLFKEVFIKEYTERCEKNNNQHFSSPEQLQEFMDDGITILNWVKSNRSKYFSIRGVRFIGAEIPLLIQANKNIPNVYFKGFIDMVLYDEVYDEYIIYDFKTSTRGWSADQKKDPIKVNQLLLYKKFFSQQKGVPEEKIRVNFFVLKRKVPQMEGFVVKKVQMFEPANGKNKINKAVEDFNSFVEDVFDDQGRYQDKQYEKTTTACKYCPFKDRSDLCDRGLNNENKFFNN